MVSFWPWGGEDHSPASFEKALSALSNKITDTQTRLDRMRTSSRKAKVLGTLYLSFAYLVYAIVLLLVVGYKNLGASEWTGMAGGPVLIYASRVVITGYYNFRTESLESRLEEQQEERAKTIQKLKDATKYDSTMELIEKYGGPEGRPRSRQQQDADDEATEAKKTAAGAQGLPNRTNIPPPPTANIQPRRVPSGSPPPSSHGSLLQPPNPLDPTAEFAPNAFNYPHPLPAAAQQYSAVVAAASAESHWYDRIFDVLLGEDETAAKNRIVLICRACRLVNGQAPPGTKSLAELGTWKCMACGTANGEMDEGKRIVREMLATVEADKDKGKGKGEDEVEDHVKVEAADDQDDKSQTVETETGSTGVDADGPAATVKARRAKGRK